MGTGYHERVRAYPRHGQSCQFLGYWQALVRGMSWHPHQSRRGTPVQQASITQVTLEDATSHNVRNHSLKLRARFSISTSNLAVLKNWHVDNDIDIFTQQKRGVITIRQEFHPSIALYLSDETACLFKLLHKPVHDRDFQQVPMSSQCQLIPYILRDIAVFDAGSGGQEFSQPPSPPQPQGFRTAVA